MLKKMKEEEGEKDNNNNTAPLVVIRFVRLINMKTIERNRFPVLTVQTAGHAPRVSLWQTVGINWKNAAINRA